MLTDLFVNISFNQLDSIEYKFQFDDMGLDAYLFLKDKLEKEIEFKIKENTTGRRLDSILSPIGVVNKKPEYFPIVFLNKFGMVIKKNTEIFVKIHGFLRDPVDMPVQMDGAHVYQAHYSFKPIIGNWNNNFTGNINPVILNPPISYISDGNLTYDLIKNTDYYEIKQITGNDDRGQTISIEFSPAIPNLLFIKSKSIIKGRFSCVIDDIQGIFAGEYSLTRTGDTIEFNIQPIKGLQPFPGKLWLKTYNWTSKIQIYDVDDIKIDSYWRRIKI